MQLWNPGPLPRRKHQIAPKRPPHSQRDLHLHGHKQASSVGSDTRGRGGRASAGASWRRGWEGQAAAGSLGYHHPWAWAPKATVRGALPRPLRSRPSCVKEPPVLREVPTLEPGGQGQDMRVGGRALASQPSFQGLCGQSPGRTFPPISRRSLCTRDPRAPRPRPTLMYLIALPGKTDKNKQRHKKKWP